MSSFQDPVPFAFSLPDSFSDFGSAYIRMKYPRRTREVTPLNRGKVKFAPLQMENIHTHFRWNNDPELNRLDSEVPYEKETFRKFKRRFEQMCHDPTPKHRNFEIHASDEDELIGVAYVGRISEHNRHGQVAVTIGERDFWGEGYGRDSLALLLTYCFEELDLHRVSAETFEYNTSWRGLVETMGFRKEGTARDYLRRDGEYWDKETYSLLQSEYRAQCTTASSETAIEQVG